MDPFESVKKISIVTIIFGVLTLLLGWSITQIHDYILRLEIGEAALVFLALFFYSLLSDKMTETEEKIRIIASARKRKTAKLVP